ncbi:MAG: ABC1 kinase family protein [Gammaproteobacteria bacterium]
MTPTIQDSLAIARRGLGQARTGLKGAARIGFTATVLASAGFGWLLGDRPPAPRLMRRTFERLGTTYIKLGQFIASSPSIFPAEYVEEFRHCLDNTPPIAFSTVRRVVESELGKPLNAVYAWVDPRPLASASIAQVHAARLHTGEDVVIKVQKPGVQDVLLTDFNFLYVAARVIELLAPGFSKSSISGVVEEIQKSMLEECDFLQEARNLDAFNAFLAATGNTRAVAPQPFHDASSLRVLTMERFYGVPLTDLETIRQHTPDPAETLVTALNTWFSSLMLCDFFHADVHAGNLMVLRDGRIGFIDFGIVGRIDRDAWQAMFVFFEAIANADFRRMAESMATIGMTHEQVDTQKLAADIERMYSRLVDIDPQTVLQADRNDLEINRLLTDIIEIGEGHGIRFPRSFALLVKQFLYFDRYVQILAPEMNIFDDERLELMPEGFLLPGDDLSASRR